MKPLITLISDWRLRDPYLSMFKGQLLSAIPDVTILDITHQVDFFDVAQTAFLMRQSYSSFPVGTIHLLLTNATHTSTFNPVVVEKDGHYFVGENNGIFLLMFPSENLSNIRQYAGNENRALSKMVSISKYLIENKIEKNSTALDSLTKLFVQMPYDNIFERKIEGSVIYIDAYFNAITNIPVEMFRKAIQNGIVDAEISSASKWKILKVVCKYDNFNEMCFIENALGCMEITIGQGKAAALADLQVGDQVTISY